MGNSWKCPYCNQSSILGDNATLREVVITNYQQGFKSYNKEGERLKFGLRCVVCLNSKCRKYTVNAGIILENSKEFIQAWSLLPDGLAKIFPDYIPKAILDDYKEACLIKDKSPKASATLSRRCLQGMIRDFWKVEAPTLYQEINQIKDKIDSDLYEAIDAIRQIGNIGAHMEKDINVIIDVDPNEAQVLIELIEMLIEEWYIKDHEKKERLVKIKAIGVEKQALKSSK